MLREHFQAFLPLRAFTRFLWIIYAFILPIRLRLGLLGSLLDLMLYFQQMQLKHWLGVTCRGAITVGAKLEPVTVESWVEHVREVLGVWSLSHLRWIEARTTGVVQALPRVSHSIKQREISTPTIRFHALGRCT